MEIISRELVLTFGTAGKDELKLAISKPAANLQPATIKSAMDAVIASAAFGESAVASKIIGAQFVVKQTDAVVFE